MNLYLLRHGQAEAQALSDSARILTETGKADIQDVVKQFSQTTESIDVCFSSPYLRAQQSAEIFLSEISSDCELQTASVLTPETRAREVLHFLRGMTAENILLVGHNPLLSELFALLTTGETDYRMKILATGELCCLSFELLSEGLGENVFNLLPEKA